LEQNHEILTIKELAEYLKIAEKTAYRFASEGKVPGFKVGSAWRFRKTEIDRWINEQERSNQKADGGDL
jgi:excisionase family DNA binding protein